MGRREFLLGTLATVTAGIAGCSALGDSENAQGTYEPSAADNLAVAVGQLNKAALSVDEFQNGDGTEGPDNGSDGEGTPSEGDTQRRTFDASKPRERVTAARKAIARAEDNGAEQADVRAVRRYADGVGGTVDAVANVTTASNRLAEVDDSFDGDDIDTDAASATLAEATTASAAARTDQEDAETALASADRERLRAVEARYDALSSGVDTLLGYIVGVEGLAVGYDTYVAGIDGVQTAEDEVDAEKFDAARESFSGAQSSFSDAESEFTDAMEGVADDLQSDLTTGEERSRALDRLSAGYISLLDSRDHVSAAESAIERRATATRGQLSGTGARTRRQRRTDSRRGRPSGTTSASRSSRQHRSGRRRCSRSRTGT
ncbi:hypothetical protein EGH22_05540 [Halomicroarcula sp. F28]|uniref:hypothetical protein n=1 Tax=Haloarcula salinisoli TaxID=2487746 RepID=UPI001C72F9EE|nr:hypothetical protein [Halomicroarcula salinisoli]MBX0285779.1 hypothetical protein [Halomicroarcula salinisoli]